MMKIKNVRAFVASRVDGFDTIPEHKLTAMQLAFKRAIDGE